MPRVSQQIHEAIISAGLKRQTLARHFSLTFPKACARKSLIAFALLQACPVDSGWMNPIRLDQCASAVLYSSGEYD